MNPDDESKVEGIAWFRTTQWTMVMLAAKRKTPAGQAALAELYEIYWLPLYAFARRRGRSPHDAQDLTQGFFLSLVKFQQRYQRRHRNSRSEDLCRGSRLQL